MFATLYEIGTILGHGSFSTVYSGRARFGGDGGGRVAIKREERTADMTTLQHETRILMLLEGIPGVPAARYYGTDHMYRYLVLDYFFPAAAPVAAAAIVPVLEMVHDVGIVHNDIKPDNIMMDAAGRPVLVDWGLARVYLGETGAHMRAAQAAPLGTRRYMSPFVQAGHVGSRRDDLISLWFVAMGAPWSNRLDDARMIDAKLAALPAELVEVDFYERPPYQFVAQVLYERGSQL